MNSEEDKNEETKAKKGSLKFKITFAFCIVVLISVFSFLAYMRTASPYADGALDNFARCLTGKGATMYGAYWCPHCQNEKRAFGSSFGLVQYVECTKETARCLGAGIKGYPTWIFLPASPARLAQATATAERAGIPDAMRFEGEQGLAKLSKESGCALP